MVAYRGSRGERIEALIGIQQLDRQMVVKKVRWAASVYGRHILILRKRADEILAKLMDEGVDLVWMGGETKHRTGVTVNEECEGGEFSDGSRTDGHTAAATTKKGLYLGQVATVIDAEMLGVAMRWENSKKVATDSQAAIRRILSLRLRHPKSWIEEIVVAMQNGKEKEIAWVKSHDGIPGTEYADLKATETGSIGRLLNQRQIPTPAGIRAIFHVNRISEQVKTWDVRIG